MLFRVIRTASLSAVLAVSSLSALTAWASESATEDLVKLLGGLDSFSAQFEQTIIDQNGARIQEAQGRMTVARGNRFHWHTELPFEQLAISNGEQVWVYDPDLEQVVIRPLGEQSANTPALLFGGDPKKVAEAFTIRQVDEHGSKITWQLEPKDEDAMFSQLEVTFDGASPTYMRMEDALGQQTGIEFLQGALNQPIEDDTFTFEPPEGTDIIQQSE